MKHIRAWITGLKRAIVFVIIITSFLLPGCGKSSSNKGLLALLAPGQTGQDKGGSAFINAAEGGSVRFNDEVSLTIPAESLTGDATISIERVTDLPQGETDGLSAFGQAYRFLPKGMEFDLANPALLELSYDSAELERLGLTPETMRICYFDESCNSYVPVNCQVDTVRKKIIAYIEHFTVYLPMAQAMLATNNAPAIGLQAPIPNPIRAGAPVYIRATVTDLDGSIAGVKLLYRKLQPSAGAWQEARMARESNAQATLHTYGYVIPAAFLTAADLGVGNDIEYQVVATDNLGASRTSAVRRYNVTRTYQAGSLSFNPAVLDIVAGFERTLVLRGVDSAAAAFSLVPETFTLSEGSGTLTNRFAQGILYKAQTVTPTGSPDQLTAGFNGDTVTASVTVHAGEIETIEILDTNGLSIIGDITMSEGTSYAFDVVGHDGYGNNIPILPAWSADPVIGVMGPNGLLDTAGFHGSGQVSASLLYASDTQNVIVQSREKEITSLSINGVAGVIAYPFITVTLPWGTDVTALVSTFTTTGQSVTVNGTAQQSGVTANDFTNPVVYRVTAEDGSTQDYTVRVRMLSPYKDITAFTIDGHDGVINGTGITVKVSFGSSVTAMVATFATTGQSVSVAGTVQVSGVTANDFTFPVTYTVLAEDGTTKNYTVTVNNQREWGVAQLIETENSGNAMQPSIAADSMGNAIAAWQQYDGTTYNAWANIYTDGTGWGTAQLLESGTGAAYLPILAYDGNSNATVAWQQTTGPRANVWAKRYIHGSGWESELMIENSIYAPTPSDVAFDNNGNAFLMTYQNEAVFVPYGGSYYASNIYAQRYTAGVGWGTPQKIEYNDNSGAFFPQVAFDGSGNAIAVWRQNEGIGNGDGTTEHIWANRYTPGSGWGVPQRLSTNYGRLGNYAAIACETDGSANVAWQGGGVQVVHYTPGSGWSAPQSIHSGTGECYDVDISTDGNGNAFCVWWQNEGSRIQAWVSRYIPGSGWQAAQRLDTTAYSSTRPDIAVDKNGNAVAVWTRSISNIGHIYASRYTAGAGWGAPVLLETEANYMASLAQVAIDGLGNAYVVWYQSDGVRTNIWANMYR